MKMANTLNCKFADLMSIMWNSNLLNIDTMLDGEYVLAIETFTGICARGVTVRGAKVNAAKEVLARFEPVDADHVREQLQQHDPDFAEVYGQSNLRMYTLRGRLKALLGAEPRRVLHCNRERKPLIRKVQRTVGMRAASAAFQSACMGRSEFPF